MIVTLATPHEPVASFDPQLAHFYDSVENFWNVSRVKGNRLQEVVLVSVGGGDRDILVRRQYLNSLIPYYLRSRFQVRTALTHSSHNDVQVSATDAPGIWVSTDHKCIAWCKQLVLALNRAFFDAVRLGKRSQVADRQEY